MFPSESAAAGVTNKSAVAAAWTAIHESAW
jgi:hypothetical protein